MPSSGGVLPKESALTYEEAWMRVAIAEATKTAPGDVPVGAIVVAPRDCVGTEGDALVDGSLKEEDLVPGGIVVGRGSNRREADGDPLAHAEVMAIRQAALRVGDGWRLENCTLVVTLEPCVMCAGTAVMARVGRIVFGAWSPKTGACGSIADVVREPAHTFVPEVRGGVLEEECSGILPTFFAQHR